MSDKILADTSINYDIAVAWAIYTKNSLQNINGLWPYQLAIGGNPQLPSLLKNIDLPTLSSKPTYQMIKDNLQAFHQAHAAFTAGKNSDHIQRALSHNIRTTGETKYLTGDNVYYKQAANPEWHGPAKVLGQDGQQVLLKHGSFYRKAHPCQLQLCNIPVNEQLSINKKQSENSEANDSMK